MTVIQISALIKINNPKVSQFWLFSVCFHCLCVVLLVLVVYLCCVTCVCRLSVSVTWRTKTNGKKGIDGQRVTLSLAQPRWRRRKRFIRFRSWTEFSLRSWRYCKRPRNKVLDKRAAKPRGEWGEGLWNTSLSKTLFRGRLQYRQLRRLNRIVLV